MGGLEIEGKREKERNFMAIFKSPIVFSKAFSGESMVQSNWEERACFKIIFCKVIPDHSLQILPARPWLGWVGQR